MINWRVRFKNRAWLVAFISQLLLVLQIVLGALNSLNITNIQLPGQLNDSAVSLINSVFVVLSLLGVIQDPTTKGFGDSERAKGYKEPN